MSIGENSGDEEDRDTVHLQTTNANVNDGEGSESGEHYEEHNEGEHQM